jgi:hypothetical protein
MDTRAGGVGDRSLVSLSEFMHVPQSLDTLFTLKLFRIPDYQRGYAWQVEQLRAFWEDLISLPPDRSHYTGVLTLKPAAQPPADAPEFWLTEDHAYRLLEIVDGQQRLTTFVIFIQALISVVRELPENLNRADAEIYLTDSLSIQEIEKRFLFETKPTGIRLRTYKFGYADDNPSYRYLRHRIFGEPDGGTIIETFYTLNLQNALRFFQEQIADWHRRHHLTGLQSLYRQITKRVLFNEYTIHNDFDVFVAFETMNNRGKPLSDLEKLKNRLIYLVTLYPVHELQVDDQRALRDSINQSWREIYHQLGRDRDHPLNDDDFLRAHWIMYFKYSRETGQDYIRFLLEDEFSPQRIYRHTLAVSSISQARELRDVDLDLEDSDQAASGPAPSQTRYTSKLPPTEIQRYVSSLQSSAVYWFTTFFPERSDTLSLEEKNAIARLNRIGIGYFRPLVMAALKKSCAPSERIRLFDAIERFIFLAFRMSWAQPHYGSSAFPRAAKDLDSGGTVQKAIDLIEGHLAGLFRDDGTINTSSFHAFLERRFIAGPGYYGWSGLRYFLYEYEVGLMGESRQTKVGWSDLLVSKKDTLSIEHIYPQTSTPAWDIAFGNRDEKARAAYGGSLGNLLLLSKSINSSLQNDSFADKKTPRFDANRNKLRNGYADGSHSEIEVSSETDWAPAHIRTRGLKLLRFLETRWNVRLRDEDRDALLFLPVVESVPAATVS